MLPFTPDEIGEDERTKKINSMIEELKELQKNPFVKKCSDRTKDISHYLKKEMKNELYYSPNEIDDMIRKEFHDDVTEAVLYTTHDYEMFGLKKFEAQGAIFYKVRDF